MRTLNFKACQYFCCECRKTHSFCFITWSVSILDWTEPTGTSTACAHILLSRIMGDEVSCQPTFLTYLQCYCATSRTREAGGYIKQTEYTHTNLFSVSLSYKHCGLVTLHRKWSWTPPVLFPHFILNSTSSSHHISMCVHTWMGVCVFVSGLHLYAKRLSGGPPARTGLEGAQGQTSVRIKGRIESSLLHSSQWRKWMSSALVFLNYCWGALEQGSRSCQAPYRKVGLLQLSK